MSAEPLLPPLPFAVFDEFGKGAEDRVQDYYQAQVTLRAPTRSAQAAAQGVTEEVRESARWFLELEHYPNKWKYLKPLADWLRSQNLIAKE